MENNGREQWDPTFLPQWENLYVYLVIFHGLIAKKPDSQAQCHEIVIPMQAHVTHRKYAFACAILYDWTSPFISGRLPFFIGWT